MPTTKTAVALAAMLAFSFTACNGQRDAGQQEGVGGAGTTTETPGATVDPGLAPGGPAATGSAGPGGMGTMPDDTLGQPGTDRP